MFGSFESNVDTPRFETNLCDANKAHTFYNLVVYHYNNLRFCSVPGRRYRESIHINSSHLCRLLLLSFGFASWTLILVCRTRELLLTLSRFLLALSLLSFEMLSIRRIPPFSLASLPLNSSSTRTKLPLTRETMPSVKERKSRSKLTLSFMALERQRRKPSLSPSRPQEVPDKVPQAPVSP